MSYPPMIERNCAMYIVPTGQLKILRNVPVDADYQNTIYFGSGENTRQASVFAGYAKFTFDDHSYQRVTVNKIRVGVNAERLYDCNYLMFQNSVGFGSYMSLMLAIFCEFCCSIFLIAGLIERLVLIPMIISMAVAFFDVHDAMLPEGELALIYLIMFIILFVTGPGRYSLDCLIVKKFNKDKQQEL